MLLLLLLVVVLLLVCQTRDIQSELLGNVGPVHTPVLARFWVQKVQVRHSALFVCVYLLHLTLLQVV